MSESRANWRTVRFGDVVRNVDEAVRDPLTCDLERFVGLEHIDPESLRIKRWGLITDGTSFTRKFTAGQVLFGKRRAYQRKVAVADFDGLCSSDILVFEPADDQLLPELLPFIVQTEGFFQHALGTSAGSLSPRTRWRDLAAYEFPLPPLDEQRRIAEILWAAEDAIDSYRVSTSDTEIVLDTTLRHVMRFGLSRRALPRESSVAYPEHWAIAPLGSIATVERGKFAHRPRNLPRFFGGPYPFAQTGDVARCRGLLKSCDQTLSEDGKAISRSFGGGTIFITIAAVIGRTAITTFDTWCTDSVVGITPSEQIDVFFLEFYLRTVRSYLESKAATQTAQKNINLGILRPLMVPVPPLQEQCEIAKTLSAMQSAIESQEQYILKLQKMKTAILSSLLDIGASARG